MFVGAYWGKRKEERDECAERIVKILNRIQRIHSALGAWYLKSRNKSKTLESLVELSPEQMSQILRTNNRDTDGSPIAELGFGVVAWNGRCELPASLAITCGAYSEFVKNSAVLDFDPSWDEIGVLSPERMRTVLIDFVEAFEPDVALVTSHEFLDRAGGGAPWESGGWLVYDRNRGVNEIIETGTFGKIN